MKGKLQIRLSRDKGQRHYPLAGICLAMGLIYLSPFTSSLTSYGAFAVCLYRMIRYDAKVLAADYCVLIPAAQIFATSGKMSLMIYVCLLAAVWQFIRTGIRAESHYVMLILLMNYLVARMQLDVSRFVLCFGQMAFLCVVLPQQDEQSAEWTAKAYCVGLLVSSGYALAVRESWQLIAVIGKESEAIWGSGILRFRGLFRDPNYYMMMLVIGIALLLKLRDCGRIRLWPFLAMCAAMGALGILTYSKTFFLVLLMLVGIYILWQIRNGKVFRGVVLIALVAAAAVVILVWEDSPFQVVITRLVSADNVDELTTGRTTVYADYLEEILSGPDTFLLGLGMAAEGLIKDPHNFYIEAAYYTGVIGLGLLVGFYASMVDAMRRRAPGFREQHLIGRYVVVFTTLVLYFTLHGMFQIMSYGGLFLAVLSIMLTKKHPAPVPLPEKEENEPWV